MHELMMRVVLIVRNSNHFVAILSVYTSYVTLDFEQRRLIGSEVLYGIIYQSLGT